LIAVVSMTNAELLEKLEASWIGEYPSDGIYSALRNVIELHKPMSDKLQFCAACRMYWQGEADVVFWPCDTIKAVEKELK